MTHAQQIDFNIEKILDTLAEKLAGKLSQDHGHLCPRLLTIDQAAVYLGRTKEAVQHLLTLGKVPTVRTDRRVFIDRNNLDVWIEDHKEHSII